MDFLGIGPLEILFILLIALILFGPKDIVKAGQTAGRFLRKLVTSPGWRAVQQTSRDLRNLPNKLIREAGLEEVQGDVNQIRMMASPKELKKEIEDEFHEIETGLSAWTTPLKDLSNPEVPVKPDNPPEETPSGEIEPVEQGESNPTAEGD